MNATFAPERPRTKQDRTVITLDRRRIPYNAEGELPDSSILESRADAMRTSLMGEVCSRPDVRAILRCYTEAGFQPYLEFRLTENTPYATSGEVVLGIQEKVERPPISRGKLLIIPVRRDPFQDLAVPIPIQLK